MFLWVRVEWGGDFWVCFRCVLGIISVIMGCSLVYLVLIFVFEIEYLIDVILKV